MSTNLNVNTSGTGSAQPRDMTGRTAIAGLFQERESAIAAIDDLKAAGFRPEDVGVAMRDRTEQGELIEETGTHAASGAVSGALGGGLLGGVLGWLVGLGALAIPGIGPVVAGGALATAFGLAGGTAVAGAGIGAAAGGLLGALVGMGIPEEEARHFESGFQAGGVLVTVNAGRRAMEALAILERNGADTGPGSVGARAGARGTGDRDAGGGGSGHPGAVDTGVGAVAGGAAGAAVGTAVAGPVGTAVGGVAGAVAGAAGGKAVHEGHDPDDRDRGQAGSAAGGTVGGAGGGVAGGVAGAAIGTAVAGPVGTIPGAAIGAGLGGTGGGAAGAAAGAGPAEGRSEARETVERGASGAVSDDDDWTTDASGNRVRRTRTDRDSQTGSRTVMDAGDTRDTNRGTGGASR